LFFEKDDFEQLDELLREALSFQMRKAGILDDMGQLEHSVEAVHPARWNLVVSAAKQNLAEFDKFCQLLSDIRDRYSVRTDASTEHPSAREEKIRRLEKTAAQSKRKADVRRAAELAVRRGEITLGTECPRGHGKLREWEGMPRCWTCGWPWKDFDPAND
jgi:hypothetical protein